MGLCTYYFLYHTPVSQCCIFVPNKRTINNIFLSYWDFIFCVAWRFYCISIIVNISNIIEGMSAASYLQMTDLRLYPCIVVNLQQGETEKSRGSGSCAVVTLQGCGDAETLSHATEGDKESGLCSESVTTRRTPLTITVTPPESSRDMDSV